MRSAAAMEARGDAGGVGVDAAEETDAIVRLRKDIKEAARTLSPREARYLVDLYYLMQKNRIAAGNQIHALTSASEPHDCIQYIAKQAELLEDNVKAVLDVWTMSDPLSVWARSICGVGPVLAAGLRAHIDFEKARTAGQVWRFAGLDSGVTWLGREKSKALMASILPDAPKIDREGILMLAAATNRKGVNLVSLIARSSENETGPWDRADVEAVMAKRPWNSKLKTLCWKIGEAFVKVKSRPQDYYGKLYEERKVYEITQNVAGQYKDQAEVGAKRVNRASIAFKAYREGRLPDGHIHARAKRWVVKLFLSHYHAVANQILFSREAPLPYPVQFLGHVDVYNIPNWPIAK